MYKKHSWKIISPFILCVVAMSVVVMSKYPKPNYEIIQHQMELMFQNATSVRLPYCEVRKINHTQNNALNFAVEISDVTRAFEYWVKIDAYERLGLEHIYRKSAFSYEMQFCAILSGDMLKFNKGLNKFGYVPESCEKAKNETYYVHNFVFDENTPLPPEVPGTHWRIDIRFYSRKDLGLIFVRFYVSIDRKHNILQQQKRHNTHHTS